MAGRSHHTGGNLEHALLRALVVRQLIADVAGETRRAPILWLEPLAREVLEGRTREFDLLCRTESSESFWYEAKRDQAPGSGKVLDDVERMVRKYREGGEKGKEQTGDRYLLAINSNTRYGDSWQDAEEAFRVTRELVDSWEDWTAPSLPVHKRVRDKIASFAKRIRRASASSEQAFAFARRIFVERVELNPPSWVKELVRERVVKDEVDAERLLAILDERSRQAFDRPTRIKMSELRALFEERGVTISKPRRIEAALEALRSADARSKLVTSLHPRHSDWKISREALVTRLATALPVRPILLCGEAGAGKSAILSDLVDAYGSENAVLLRAEVFDQPTRALLNAILLAGCTAEEVFALWSRGTPKLLAIDGVDEIEGASVHERLSESLEAAHEAGINIVIAARSTDAEYFARRTLQRLSFQQEELPPTFSLGELRAIAELPGIPDLLFLEQSDRRALRLLTKRPFYLRLLVELLEGRGGDEGLRNIGDEAALLGEYWKRRVADCSRSEELDLERAACRIAVRVMNAHGGDVPIGDEDGRAVTELRSQGVFLPGADRAQFTSRILRDYAFVRAAHRGMVEGGLDAWLAHQRGNASAHTVIRLDVLQRKSSADPSTSHPWRRLHEILSGDLSEALCLTAVRCLVESLETGDVAQLLEVLLSCSDPRRADFTQDSFRTRWERIERANIVEETDIELLDRGLPRFGAMAGTFGGRYLASAARAATREQRERLSRCFQWAWDEIVVDASSEGPLSFGREILSAAPALLRHEALEPWLMQASEQHVWVAGDLARGLFRTPTDPEGVMTLASIPLEMRIKAWSALMKREQAEDREKAYGYEGMLRYDAVQAVPELLKRSPGPMTEVICEQLARRAALVAAARGTRLTQVREAIRGRSPQRLAEEPPTVDRKSPAFKPSGVSEPVCEEDESYSWARNPSQGATRDDVEVLNKLVYAWRKWLDKEGLDEQSLTQSFQCLRRAAKTALPWKAFLEFASSLLTSKDWDTLQPNTRELVAQITLEFLIDPGRVGSQSVSFQAGYAMVALASRAEYAQQVEEVARRLFEHIESSSQGDGVTRAWIRNAILCLDDSSLPAVRRFAQAVKCTQEEKAYKPGSTFYAGCSTPSEEELDRLGGIRTNHPQYLELANRLRNVEKAAREFAAGELDRKDFVEVLRGFEGDILTRLREFDCEQGLRARRLYFESWVGLARQCSEFSPQELAWAREVLREAARTADDPPESSPDARPRQTGSARSLAAKGLARIAYGFGLEIDDRACLEGLARDLNSDVRLSLAGDLGSLRRREEDLMWSLAGVFAQREHGPSGACIVALMLVSLQEAGSAWNEPDRFIDLLRAVRARGESGDLMKVGDLVANLPSPQEVIAGAAAGLWIWQGNQRARELADSLLDSGSKDVATLASQVVESLEQVVAKGEPEPIKRAVGLLTRALPVLHSPRAYEKDSRRDALAHIAGELCDVLQKETKAVELLEPLWDAFIPDASHPTPLTPWAGKWYVYLATELFEHALWHSIRILHAAVHLTAEHDVGHLVPRIVALADKALESERLNKLLPKRADVVRALAVEILEDLQGIGSTEARDVLDRIRLETD